MVAAHRGAISRARNAGSTPDIDTSHAMLVGMLDTVPMLVHAVRRKGKGHGRAFLGTQGGCTGKGLLGRGGRVR